jgi:hypothetical protein
VISDTNAILCTCGTEYAVNGRQDSTKTLKKGEADMKTKTHLNKFDKLMMAVTFAEAGEHDIAREIINDRPRKRTRDERRKDVRTRTDQRPRLRT